MKVAREGLILILVAMLLAVGAFALALSFRSWALWLLAIAFTAVALWVVYFFRDPERPGDRGASLVIAPADGRVLMVSEVDEPAFLHGRATRISIFMNIFNVHVNRYPVAGTVRFVHYNPGKFLHAAADKSSLENEHMSVGIDTGRSRVLVRQIAGLIARRVITYSREGELVEQGERMGIIRFGSRVDIFVPVNANVTIAAGQTTMAGVTVMATLADA